MTQNKIILEDRFTTHQKITLLFYLGSPIIAIIYFLIKTDLSNFGYMILAIFILIYSVIIGISFSKRGLIKRNSSLYRGLFVFGKLFLKKKIDLANRPKVSILKFNRSQKIAFFSAAKPDLSESFNCFEINILNEKHTEREELVSLKKNVNAENTVEFLTSNFELKNEIYSPNFR